jgi:DNA helicase HerA-like ATPase
MIDEVKILSHGRGDPNKSNLILNTLATQARKFGVGLILASQMNSHFSEEVRANFAGHLAMKRMDPSEARKVAPRLEVAVQDLISSESPPGVGFLRSASTGGTVLLRANQCPGMPAGEINGV